MSLKIPEELKTNVPASRWGKVLAATPVVMTVIATLLAGLASSEMTRAQYDRALAAQQQSKAGDQWGFFQAKRLRSAIQLGSLDVIQAAGAGRKLDAAGLRNFAAAQPGGAAMTTALEFLLSGKLPDQAAAPVPDSRVQAALDAVDRGATEAELAAALNAAPAALIGSDLRAAQAHARAFDELTRPVIRGGDALGDLLDPATTSERTLSRDFTILRLRYSALRFDTEARLNQAVAHLYELQVRQSNLSAERHHRRSSRFFYGMLAAQAAVIIATLAMAAQRRSLLWTLAACAGLAALASAIYVYVYV